MRILIDITHPAHLHFFSHAIARLRERGHEVVLTGRDKDILIELARRTGTSIEFFGGALPGPLGMARTLLARQLRLALAIRRLQPDVLAAVGGTFIAAVGYALRVPVVVFSDTESATLSNAVTYPFTTRLCTPEVYGRTDRRGQVRYAGYHECAYLHPALFQPDASVLSELGVNPGERYCIVRFVGWGASHDLGRSGLRLEDKVGMVRALAEHGRVFVSSEGALPAELEAHRFSLPVERMHHALAHASLIVGESSTMSAEAAVLGVPSVFIYPRVELGPTRDLAERWQILHWFTSGQLIEARVTACRLFADDDRGRFRAVAARIAEHSADVPEVICEQLLAAVRDHRG
ncbi:MAG: DUF354 domain-containing protein [Myxococcales bacterium]|nr:DUF354 domain-containing protein [Myxococcales bacterium]